MDYLAIFRFLKPFLSMLLTIGVLWVAFKALREDVMGVIRVLIEELRDLIAARPSLMAWNMLFLLIATAVAIRLFIPNPVFEMLSNLRGERDPEILQFTKLGADCFVFFMLVVAGLLCVKMCRQNNP
jgi:hypothetical protein